MSVVLIISCGSRSINDYKYKCNYKYKDINLNAVHCGNFYFENLIDMDSLFIKDTLYMVNKFYKDKFDLKIDEHFVKIHFQYNNFNLDDYRLDSIFSNKGTKRKNVYSIESYMGDCYIDTEEKTLNISDISKYGLYYHDQDTTLTLDFIDLIPKGDTLSYKVELLEFDKKRYYKRVRLIKK